jgi:hypothetical protein
MNRELPLPVLAMLNSHLQGDPIHIKRQTALIHSFVKLQIAKYSDISAAALSYSFHNMQGSNYSHVQIGTN